MLYSTYQINDLTGREGDIEMKKILAMLMVALFIISAGALSACKSTTSSNAADDYLYEEAKRIVTENTGKTNALISKEFTDTEEYRIWTATLGVGGSEFQVAVPIEYTGHELSEDEKLELTLDVGDNWNYLVAQETLKKYPELGTIISREFDYSVISDTKAEQAELNELYLTYLRALKAMGSFDFSTRVTTPEGEVLFTPYF